MKLSSALFVFPALVKARSLRGGEQQVLQQRNLATNVPASRICVKNGATISLKYTAIDTDENNQIVASVSDGYGKYSTETKCRDIDSTVAQPGDNIQLTISGGGQTSQVEYLVYEPDAGTAQYLCKGNGIVGLNCHLENVSRKLDKQDLDDENDGDEFEKEFSDDAALVTSSSSHGPYYADTICVKNAASAWVGWKSYDEENGALVAQSKDSSYGYYGTVTECDGIDGSKANEGDNVKTIITISTHDHVMDGSDGVIYKPGAGTMHYKCKGNELIRYNCFPDM